MQTAIAVLWTAAASAAALTPALRVPPRAPYPHMLAAQAATGEQTLVGYDAFQRKNPLSDRFEVLGFHHVEFYCSDATCTAGRFAHALGMDVLASSRNDHFASIAIGSGDVRLSFTAPMPPPAESAADAEGGLAAALGYDRDAARAFIADHGGVAVRAVCVRVADVRAAYDACLSGGGQGVLSPRPLPSDASDDASGEAGSAAEVAEPRDRQRGWATVGRRVQAGRARGVLREDAGEAGEGEDRDGRSLRRLEGGGVHWFSAQLPCPQFSTALFLGLQLGV